MSFTTVNSTGVLIGANGQRQVSLSSAASNVLTLRGTDSNTLAKLRGVDQPSDDTDATSRSYVQNYVTTRLQGLQTKLAVRLASLTNINLSGGVLEQNAQVLRWESAGPDTDFLLTPDSQGRTIQPYSYRSAATNSWTVAYIWTPTMPQDQWSDEIALSFSFGPNYDNRNSSFRDIGPKLPLIDGLVTFYNTVTGAPARFQPSVFPTGEPIYFLNTYNGVSQTATITIAKYQNGAFTVPTPVSGANPSTQTVAQGFFSGDVGDQLCQMQPSVGGFTKIVLANKVLTLLETFGPAPQGWTTTGIDGIVPSANDRILLAGQTNAVQNGIWQVSSDGTVLERPGDFAVGSDAKSAYVFANGSGELNDNKGFLCTNNSAAIVGTDAQTWQVYTAAGGLGGLSVNGSTISTSSAAVSFANPVAVGTTTVSPATIADSSGTLTFQNTNISAPAVSSGTLRTAAGSLTDSSGSISMGSTNLSTTGSLTATAYTSPSDANLKSNPVPLSATWTDADGTQRSLYDLTPVSFMWKRNRDVDFGVIAQDSQSLLDSFRQDRGDGVAPYPLRITGTDGTNDVNMTFDYAKLSVLCLAMCKDLRQLVTGEGPGTGLAELVGTPYQDKPPDMGDDLWSAVRYLYQRIEDIHGYLRSLASQIQPPAQMLAPGVGFGIYQGDANLPHLAGTDPSFDGYDLPALPEWV